MALSPAAVSAQSPCTSNPVVCENQKAGTDKATWDIAGAGDLSIQGFASAISVQPGERIDFRVKTDAAAFRIDVYRIGFYGGAGARLVGSIVADTGRLGPQPECLQDKATGLIDCGNWHVSASWSVPKDAVSGLFVGRLGRTDTGGASHMPFIVRHDARPSDVLVRLADTTWHAYNDYGGNSLYAGLP